MIGNGSTRALPKPRMEQYAEIIAALKLRTSNKKGRHLSTQRAIEILEDHGVETPDGLIRAPKGALSRATVDRFMKVSGYDLARVIRPVAAVRFQAKRSNELWHFDISPSDLKQVKAPLWLAEPAGCPQYSAADPMQQSTENRLKSSVFSCVSINIYLYVIDKYFYTKRCAMGLSIKDSRTETAVRKLAEMKKISMTDAVRIAVENEIIHLRQELPLVDKLRAIGDKFLKQGEPTGELADKAFFDKLGGE